MIKNILILGAGAGVGFLGAMYLKNLAANAGSIPVSSGGGSGASNAPAATNPPSTTTGGGSSTPAPVMSTQPVVTPPQTGTATVPSDTFFSPATPVASTPSAPAPAPVVTTNPTPTPAPACIQVTFSANQGFSSTAYWTDCNGVKQSKFVNAGDTLTVSCLEGTASGLPITTQMGLTMQAAGFGYGSPYNDPSIAKRPVFNQTVNSIYKEPAYMFDFTPIAN